MMEEAEAKMRIQGSQRFSKTEVSNNDGDYDDDEYDDEIFCNHFAPFFIAVFGVLGILIVMVKIPVLRNQSETVDEEFPSSLPSSLPTVMTPSPTSTFPFVTPSPVLSTENTQDICTFPTPRSRDLFYHTIFFFID
jgi:hypothetical protein